MCGREGVASIALVCEKIKFHTHTLALYRCSRAHWVLWLAPAVPSYDGDPLAATSLVRPESCPLPPLLVLRFGLLPPAAVARPLLPLGRYRHLEHLPCTQRAAVHVGHRHLNSSICRRRRQGHGVSTGTAGRLSARGQGHPLARRTALDQHFEGVARADALRDDGRDGVLLHVQRSLTVGW